MGVFVTVAKQEMYLDFIPYASVEIVLNKLKLDRKSAEITEEDCMESKEIIIFFCCLYLNLIYTKI